MEQKERLYYGIRKTKFGFKATEITKDEFWGQRELPYSFDYGAYVSSKVGTDGYISNGCIYFFICDENGDMKEGELTFGNWLLDNKIDFGGINSFNHPGYHSHFNVKSIIDNKVFERYVLSVKQKKIDSLIESVFDYILFLSDFDNLQSITLYDAMDEKNIVYYDSKRGGETGNYRTGAECRDMRDKFNLDVISFIDNNRMILSEQCIKLLRDRLNSVNSIVHD